MRIIIGTIAGVVAGFVTSVLVAPRSGKETRQDINKQISKPVKNGRMLFNKVAYKTGLISEKKKAELNKQTIEAYNAKNNVGQPGEKHLHDRLEKAHETDRTSQGKVSAGANR